LRAAVKAAASPLAVCILSWSHGSNSLFGLALPLPPPPPMPIPTSATWPYLVVLKFIKGVQGGSEFRVDVSIKWGKEQAAAPRLYRWGVEGGKPPASSIFSQHM